MPGAMTFIAPVSILGGACSEYDLYPELPLSWWVGVEYLAGIVAKIDLSGAVEVNGVLRNDPLDIIEEVEKLETELQLHVFADRVVLEQREVGVESSRTPQDVPAFTAINYVFSGQVLYMLRRRPKSVGVEKQTRRDACIWIPDQFGPEVAVAAKHDRIRRSAFPDGYEVYLPPADQSVAGSAFIKESPAFSKRQIVYDRGRELMPNVKAGIPLFALEA